MAVEAVLFESTTETSAKCYTLSLNAAVVFRNLLPLTVVCESQVVVRKDVLNIQSHNIQRWQHMAVLYIIIVTFNTLRLLLGV